MPDTLEQSFSRALAGKEEQRLLTAFFVLYKTARIVEASNATFTNQLDNFYDQLSRLAEESSNVTIKLVSDRYFVNDRLVHFDGDGLSGAASVIEEWKTLGVGGVTFQEGISKDEMQQFIVFMSSVKPSTQNLESLSMSLRSHMMSNIQLLSLKELMETQTVIPEAVRKQFRQAARTSFFRAMSVVEEAITNTLDNREINASKTKRVVHSLIDHISRDESSLIELASIKDFDDYTYAHSTNVCVYSLTLGVRLGLDRARLSQLGFSALFHDIGKVKLPTDLIRKPDAFDEDDWIQMQRHPILGAKTILRNLTLDIHAARAARTAFEHHINNDFTGYPVLRYKNRRPILFSRIVSIADTFDALSSGRVYLKKSIPPDIVMKKMRYQMKIKFDSLLLSVFNDIIGIYPSGSLVLLTTDEIALIITGNEQQPARPYVKIVGDSSGLMTQPVWADLSLPENDHRKIIRMIDPKRYGLDIKQFILQD
ncbi:MAG: HD-GYP domain-containing protein [Candidatus Zixiibacteriota bacterium]